MASRRTSTVLPSVRASPEKSNTLLIASADRALGRGTGSREGSGGGLDGLRFQKAMLGPILAPTVRKDLI